MAVMHLPLRALLAASLLGVATISAADITKANNTTDLGLGGSWVSGVAPTAADIALWDATVAAANTVNLGGNLDWGGIRVASPGGAVTIRHAANQSLTLGSGGITLSGSQNLTLLSAITANTAGTLVVGASQTWSVASGRILTLFSTSNSANQRLSGTGDIRVTGGGVVNMNVGDLGSTTFAAGNGNDTFSGNWTIDGGSKVITLRNGTHAWGRGAITLDNGTISQNSGNWSWSNAITVGAGGGTIFNDSSGTGRYLNLTGIISGSGALSFGSLNAMTTQEGFILTGANTFTGPMTIAANATVRIGGDATTAMNSTAAGTLGSIDASVAITNNGRLGFGRTDAWTFANVVTGTGIVRLGRSGGVLPSTQVVTLSAASTYTGATEVNAGRLNLTGSLTSAITVASGASISGTGSTTGLLTLSSGAGLVLAGGATTAGLTVNGATFGGSNLVSFLSDPVAGEVYVLLNYGVGVVTNPGNLAVGWRGSVSDDFANQRYIFTAGSSGTRTWVGGTGTWSQGVAGRFAEGDQTFYGGDDVVFNDAGAAATITLSGRLAPGSVTFNNSANPITLAGTDGSSDLTGVGELVKQGAGTLIINSAQTYTGGTLLQGGVLELSGSSSSLGSGAVTLSAGSTLALNRSAAFTFSTSLAGQGRVSKAGAGRYTISGANSAAAVDWYFGIADPLASGLGFSNSAALGGAGSSFTVGAGFSGSAFFNSSGNTTSASVSIGDGGTFTWNGSTGNTTTITGVITGSGSFSKVSGETLRLTGVHTHTGPISITGGGVLEIAEAGQLGQGSYAGAITIGGGRLSINSTADQELSGVLSGAGRLDKSGAGTLSLSGLNTYSGGTEHLGGRLEVSALSGIGAGYLAVKNGGTFAFTGSVSETTTRNLFLDLGASVIEVASASATLTWDDASAKNGDFTKLGAGILDLGGAFSGTAAITVDGGLLRLRGANTFTGDITVSSGQIEIAGSGSLGSGAYAGGVFLSGGSLSWASSAIQTLSGAMSGGGLVVSAGELTLSGASTRTGDTSVTGGVLVIANADALRAGSVLVGASGTLRIAFTPDGPTSFDRPLLGSGIVDIATGGTQPLSLGSAAGFAGAVRLTSGVFDPGSWSGTVLYAGGSMAAGFGGYAGPVTVQSGASFSPASLGIPDDLGVVTGGELDFAGAPASALTARIRWSGGLLTNAAAYVGTVDIRSDATLVAGSFGSGVLELGAGRSVTLGAGLANQLRLTSSAVTLAGLESYSGLVELAAGVAFSTGSEAAPIQTSAAFVLQSGARLSGSGSVGDTTVTSGGILSPGNSPGTLTFENLVLEGGGVLNLEILNAQSPIGGVAAAGIDYDTVVVTDTLDLSGVSSGNRFIIRLLSLASTNPDLAGDVNLLDLEAVQVFDLYGFGTILGAGAGVSNLFSVDTTGFLAGGQQVSADRFTVSLDTQAGLLQLTYAPIPEPSTYGLILGGLVLATAAVRRRRKG